MAFVDDVIIPTTGTFDDHMRDVGMVFDRLMTAGFKVRCDKVHLAMRQVPYLGFMVGNYGTKPLEDKTASLLELTQERMGLDPAAAARFAGGIGFYHAFIENLQFVMAPFHALKCKGAPVADIMMSLQFKMAFERCKHQLANVTALARPDYNLPMYVTIDSASSMGTGGMLTQFFKMPDGTEVERPLRFRSRRFKKEETRLGSRDQECIGLSEALVDWREYLLGGEVVVRTDHKSLQWLLSTIHKDGSAIAGIALKVQQYSLRIEHVSGTGKIIKFPDCLSRSTPLEEGVTASDSFPEDRGYLQGRPTIEDRVDEATGVLPTVSAALLASTHTCQSYLATCLQIAATVQPPAAESYRGDAGVLVATIQLNLHAPLAESMKLSPDRPSPEREVENTAAILFVRSTPSAGGLEILLQVAPGEVQCSLPSISLRSTGAGTHRAQLQRYLSAISQSNEKLAGILGGSSRVSHKTPCGKRGTFFISTHPDLHSLVLPDGLVFSPLSDAAFTVEGVVEEGMLRRLTQSANLQEQGRTVSSSMQSAISGLTPSALALATTSPAEDVIPTIATSPFGPCFIRSLADAATAVGRMAERLQKHADLCLTVDLEGQLGTPYGFVSLIQFAVDAREAHEKRLVYVFDTLESGLLDAGSGDTIRTLLENAAIVKNFHCCHGDQLSLYYLFGIQTKRVFDTGVADCLVMSRLFNSPRRLDVVTYEYLGQKEVFLQHKGKLAMSSPHIFNERPLPLIKFEYAFEDVLYGGRLYDALMARLAEQGLVNVAFQLSQHRAPPIALPQAHPRHQPVDKIAIALTDGRHVLCMYDGDELVLPSAEIPDDLDSGSFEPRKFAILAWERLLGPPPKGVNAAVNAHLRRVQRLGDTMVFEAKVSFLPALLEPLECTFRRKFPNTPVRFWTRPLFMPNEPPSHGVRKDQASLFEFLHYRASLTADMASGIEHSVDPPTAVTGPTTDCNVLLGKRREDHCAALILHDDQRVYVVTRNDEEKGNPHKLYFAFPSHPVMVGSTPQEAVLMAVNRFMGPALLKRGDAPNSQEHLAFPKIGSMLSAALEKMVPVRLSGANGVEERCGNTVYFSCYFPLLTEYMSTFWAARQSERSLLPSVGFSMLPSVRQLYPGFDIISSEAALNGTEARSPDHALFREAVAASGPLRLCDRRAFEAVMAFQTPPIAQSLAVNESAHSPAPVSTKRTPVCCDKCACKAYDTSLPDIEEEEEHGFGWFGNKSDATWLEDPLSQCGGCEEPAVKVHLSFDVKANGAESPYVSTNCRPVARNTPLSLEALALSAIALQSGDEESSKEILALASGPTKAAKILENSPLHGSKGGSSTNQGLPAVAPLRPRRQRFLDSIGASPTADPLAGRPGDDPVFDALFESHVAVCFATELEKLPTAQCNAGKAGAAGMPPSATIATGKQVIEEQALHPATKAFIEYLNLGALADPSDFSVEFIAEASNLFIAKSGMLMRRPLTDDPDARPLIVLPPKFHPQVFEQYHDRCGHFGVKKVLPMITSRFCWGGGKTEMGKDLAEYIKTCEPCARVKPDRHSAGEMFVSWSGDHCWDLVSADHFKTGKESVEVVKAFEMDDSKDAEGQYVWKNVKLRYDGTVSFACHLSRMIRCAATRGNPTSEEVAKHLMNIVIRYYGTPRAIRSDRGSNFVSAAIKALYARYGITMHDGMAYHHQTVGIVERWHLSLKTLLLTHRVASGSDDWHLHLPALEAAFNSAVNATTGFSPFYVNNLRESVQPSDTLLDHGYTDPWVENSAHDPKPKDLPEWLRQILARRQVCYDTVNKVLHVNALNQKKRWDLKHDVVVRFEPGQQVLLYKGSFMDKKAVHPKADLPTEGPFTVSSVLPRDRYVLRDFKTRRIHNVVHISRLKPFFKRKDEVQHKIDGLYPVRYVVDRRKVVSNDIDLPEYKGTPRVQYKIRWLGFGKGSDCWRDEALLQDIKPLLDAFDKHNKIDGVGIDTPVPREPTIADAPRATPSAEAIKRSRFRARPARKEVGTEPTGETEPQSSTDFSYLEQPVDEVPVDNGPTSPLPADEQDVDQPPFEKGDRVTVFWPRYSARYPGVVKTVFLPRAKHGAERGFQVKVLYDGFEDQGLHEHDVRHTDIELLKPSPLAIPNESAASRAERLRAQRLAERSARRNKTTPAPPLASREDHDSRLARRLSRALRQLS